MVTALRTRLGQYLLFLREVEGLVLQLVADRADAKQPSACEFEIGDDVLQYRARLRRPFLGVLVIGVHVPVLQRFPASPEADFVVPAGIFGMHPPREMQESW